MNQKFPFRNLIFKGGGIKAFAYIGAIEILGEMGILRNINRLAGNSAGSIMATLLSLRLSVDETIRIFDTLDQSKITPFGDDEETEEGQYTIKTLWEKRENLRDGMDAINRLLQNYGLFSSEHVHNWLQEVIASQCHGNGRATFEDFQELGFRDLHIVATNVSAHKIMEFSAAATPKVVVADATAASSSIPLFFEAFQFDGECFGQGDYIADGGILTNYPINIFDNPNYGRGNQHYSHGINWETLGCRLYTPQECKRKIKPITNIFYYIQNLIETLSIAEDHTFENNLVDQFRTINISDCCVDTTEFNIKPGEPKYNELVIAGRTATQQFLEDYKLPTDRIADLKSELGDFLKR